MPFSNKLLLFLTGEVANLTPPESFATSSLQPFAYGVAFYQGLWAYDGW